MTKGAPQLPIVSQVFSLSAGPRCYILCVPWGVWVFASFFTSAWVWIYVLTGALVKMLCWFGISICALDIDTKPIASLGWVGMVLVSVTYWAAAILKL